MTNRTSYTPAGALLQIPEDEISSVDPVNPVSPQIITETVTAQITRQGPNIKKKVSE
jgi:hypothetical protein